MDQNTLDKYRETKRRFPSAVLMYEQSDSYLLCDQDARTVATLLEVSIGPNEALMLPRHWMEPTLQRLRKAGHVVAVKHLHHSLSVCAEPQWPYRRCDFCGRERNPSGVTRRHFERRAWTYYPTAMLFGCPDCRQQGMQAEHEALLQQQPHGERIDHNNAA